MNFARDLPRKAWAGIKCTERSGIYPDGWIKNPGDGIITDDVDFGI